MKTKIRDKDLAGVGKALRRAGNQARKIALETNTPLIVLQDGKIIKLDVGKRKKRKQANKS